MRYLIDTDICIYAIRKRSRTVIERFETLKAGEAGLSIITYLELLYGAYKSQQTQNNLAVLQELISVIPVLSLETSVGKHYGRLRAGLERRGTPIGSFDLLIAAHAASAGLTLITNNKKEFSRIPGLKVEAWI